MPLYIDQDGTIRDRSASAASSNVTPQAQVRATPIVNPVPTRAPQVSPRAASPKPHPIGGLLLLELGLTIITLLIAIASPAGAMLWGIATIPIMIYAGTSLDNTSAGCLGLVLVFVNIPIQFIAMVIGSQLF